MAALSTSATDLEVKILTLCRTCLAEENDMQSIFAMGTQEHFPLHDIISTVTGIKFTEGDGLPSTVCKACRHSAIQAFQFKQKTEKADTSLRAMIVKRKYDKLDNIKLEEHKLQIKYEFPNEDGDDFNHTDFSLDHDFPELDDIKDESKKEEKEESEHQCKVCNSMFDLDSTFKDHVCVKVECDDDKSSYCPLCGLNFDDPQKLLKHVWSDHNDVMGKKKRGRPKKLLTRAGKKTKTKLPKGMMEAGDDNTAMFLHQIEAQLGKFERETCGICNSIFQCKEELVNHFQDHKCMKVYCCMLCGRMFSEEPCFQKHFLCHEKLEASNQLTTKESPLVFDKQSSDNKLDSNDNQNSFKFLNEITIQELLDSNMHTEITTLLQLCSLCNGIFLSEEDLIQHNDNEHPDYSHRCNFCFKLFTSTKTAARHRKLCERVECKHQCSSCKLKFSSEMSLNKHILRQHEGKSVSVKFIDPKYKQSQKKFVCGSCNKSFYRQELLDRHARVHMPNERKYECDICKKKFNRKDNLRSHTQIHDPNRKKLPSNCLCLYCGRSFSNSSNLIVHMRRHTGEKPYKCDFCGKGFPRSSDLQCHRRSHTGEKPCLCTICGKGFSRSNKLSRHMRVHTGQKPYKCTYCEKAFSQSNDLTLHVRRHTGDKPYVCEVCGDRFIQGTALHNHRRTHGHYPSTAASSQTIGMMQNKAIRSTLTATLITSKKIIDVAK